MRSRADARSFVDCESDVIVLDDLGFAGMQSHADAHQVLVRPTMTAESDLAVQRRGDSVARSREGDEEPVPPRAELVSAVCSERLSKHLAVLGEYVLVSVAQLLQEPCRPLDVGE